MKALGYLLFVAFIISNIKSGSYSIYTFIDYLQETGQYDVIQVIKIYIGDDYAIEYCKQVVVQTDHCEEVVKVYMTSGGSSGPRRARRKAPTEEDLNQQSQSILKLLNISEDDEKRELVILILSYYDNLRITMSIREIYNLINYKILKRKRIFLKKEIITEKIIQIDKLEIEQKEKIKLEQNEEIEIKEIKEKNK